MLCVCVCELYPIVESAATITLRLKAWEQLWITIKFNCEWVLLVLWSNFIFNFSLLGHYCANDLIISLLKENWAFRAALHRLTKDMLLPLLRFTLYYVYIETMVFISFSMFLILLTERSSETWIWNICIFRNILVACLLNKNN